MTGIIDVEKCCRLCLDTTHEHLTLDEKTDEQLIASIESYTNLKFSKETYEHPQINLMPKLCINCCQQIKAFDKFRKHCIESDNYLREVIAELLLNVTDNLNDITDETEEIEALPFDQVMQEPSHCHIDVHIQNDDDRIARQKGQKKCRKDYNIACEICGKTYTKGDMKFHLNSHYGIRPYVCEIDDCLKTFPSPFLLQRHKKVTHSNIKRYECDICGKKFKQSSVLKFHRSYHGEPQLPCGVCGKMMRNERALKKHMMVHTGERPYTCSVCQKSFQTSYTLRIHRRVHTNEKPYVCTKCGNAYAYNCLLKAHTDKHHPNDTDLR